MEKAVSIQEEAGSQLTLMGRLTSYCFTQTIACATKLGVADVLAKGPRNADELARETGCSAAHLTRLMRPLCALGIFKLGASGYELTPVSRNMRKDADVSMAPVVMFHAGHMYRALEQLENCVRSGTPAWTLAYGAPLVDYLAANPEVGALFGAGTWVNYTGDAERLIESCAFGPKDLIVDVGGGEGAFTAEILQRQPGTRAVLFDRPEVIARARASARWDALRDRCQFQAGDFFSSIPAGGDAYLLRHVLRDWSDADSVRILRNCRAAAGRGGRVLIAEILMGTREAEGWGEWADLGAMVFGGQERSQAEYTQLLAEAGLAVVDVRSAGLRAYVIEAKVN